jgi:hypothetical protein
MYIWRPSEFFLCEHVWTIPDLCAQYYWGRGLHEIDRK